MGDVFALAAVLGVALVGAAAAEAAVGGGSLGSVFSTPQAVPEMTAVVSVEGSSAHLPCDISPPNPKERVYLVLWYRRDEGEPIYSYDARSGGGVDPNDGDGGGRRWSDDFNGFGARAFFQVRPSVTPARLNLEDVKKSEEGVYRCRVDFKTAPTRNTLVNLTVIVPPKKPTIFNERGEEALGTVGPYMIGDSVSLKCIAVGGDPPPQVTWWRDSHLIDSSYEGSYSRTVQNGLKLKNVSRAELGAQLTCQASNNNLSLPVSSRVTVDMKFKPATVTILSKKKTVSAGRLYLIECESAGARPAAVVTWYKNNRFLGKTDSKILSNGNLTRSVLQFRPTHHDQGKTLTCRAENTKIPGSAAEDKWKLTVHHAPMVRLKLGPSLDPDNIAEGNDVYFECSVTARPEPYKVIWLHNDVMVRPDRAKGVIISSGSLVLQRVTRRRAGNYTCVASNVEGDRSSNAVTLEIMFKPTCANRMRIVQGIGRGRSASIVCPVEAHPRPTKYSWYFNNSSELETISATEYTFNSTHSELVYSPKDDDDFGLIYCKAENAMGPMGEPCVFTVIPAGPPEPPANCSVVNQTTESLVVECLPGFDGGLDQLFHMEVTDLQTGQLITNTSGEPAPEFEVSGLNSGRGMKITIFAANADGRSDSAVLEGFTLKVAELQLESPVPLEFTPVLGILIGVVLTLFVIALVIILVLRLKYKSSVAASRKRCDARPAGSSSSGRQSCDNNGGVGGDSAAAMLQAAAMPTPKDAEEYYCLRQPDPDETGSSLRSSPDVVAQKGAYKYHGGGVLHSSHQSPLIHETEFTAATSTQPPPNLPSGDSGASVNSDYSSGGNSCSTAGGDRSPPYLPRNPSNSAKRNNGRILHAQQPKNLHHLPAFSASSSSPAIRFNRGVNFPHHNTNVIVNPTMEESGEGEGGEPKSWMPLLVSRRQQESDL